MVEEWRTTHVSEKHEVSNFGRVRSWAVRGSRTAIAKTPKLRKLQRDKDGYFWVSFNDAKKKVFVHTLMLTAFVGPRPKGQLCRHLDGNPEHNTLDNVCWGTEVENKADARRHGTLPLGERHGSTKLSPIAVDAIRISTGPIAEIAARYGITDTMVSNIRLGEAWKERIGATPETAAAVAGRQQGRRPRKVRQLTP